jgi:hypothetical protein
MKKLFRLPIFQFIIKHYFRILFSWGMIALLKHYTLKTSLMAGHKIVIPDFVVGLLALGLAFLTRLAWNYIIKPGLVLLATTLGVMLLVHKIPKDSRFYFLQNPTNLVLVISGLISAVGLFFIYRWWSKRYNLPNYYKTIDQIDNFGRNAFGKLINTKLSGTLFEEYLVSMFRGLGYEAATIAELKALGKVQTVSVDQGADILLVYYDNGVKKKIIVQCKHYVNKVDNGAVQEAHSAKGYYEADDAMVVTNNYFTAAAVELANKERINVTLIDRDKLIVLNNQAAAQSKKKVESLINKVRAA